MKHLFRNILPYGIMLGLVPLACIYLFTPDVSIQVNRGLSMLSLHDVKGLTMQLNSLGNQAVLLAVILDILQLLYAPLPLATVLTATVRIVGPMVGILVSWLGLWLGAAVAFGIARAFLRPILHKFLEKRVFFRLDNFAQQYGVLLLIAGWLIPGWPAELVAYLAGISCLSFRPFMGATAIAIIPNLGLVTLWGEIIPTPFIYALYMASWLCIIIVVTLANRRKKVL